MPTATESQLTDAVLMIRPVRFQQNPLTAASNAFMEDLDVPPETQQAAASEQFLALRDALRVAGVRVFCFDDTPEPHTPDSVFPNNWVSMHADGRVVLYPMEAPNRRTERRRDVLDSLVSEHGFSITELVDLTALENDGVYLEGTGSLVLDRPAKLAFACLSSRTHKTALDQFARRMNYTVVPFNAVDRNGVPIYHTNVLMSIGEKLVPICLEAIRDRQERAAVVRALEGAGHRLLPLSYAQLESFAGNMLEIANAAGERVVAMSHSALESLDSAQRDALEQNGHVVSCDISDIEASAGGSVRCMLAAIHLPHANDGKRHS